MDNTSLTQRRTRQFAAEIDKLNLFSRVLPRYLTDFAVVLNSLLYGRTNISVRIPSGFYRRKTTLNWQCMPGGAILRSK